MRRRVFGEEGREELLEGIGRGDAESDTSL